MNILIFTFAFKADSLKIILRHSHLSAYSGEFRIKRFVYNKNHVEYHPDEWI